tara:strand:- start:699 stop:935 length:237 start_codon:yes stop_codon:yes gene_type:complete
MTDSEIVFNEVLKEIVSVNNCLSNDENECEFCGGDSIVYIENDEWEECVFCCSSDTDTSDSDSDYNPYSSDNDSDVSL